MLNQQVVHADGTSLKQELEAKDLVIVDFWAAWCAPCRAMAPMLDRLAGEYPSLWIIKVDADANREFLDVYDVKSLPTLLVYRSGKRIEQLVGKVPYAMIHRAIHSAVHAAA
ncbi:MAG: thioredoxin family protein [Hyphomicrobium sp.]